MATNISITPANVKRSANGQVTFNAFAGATIAAGETCYVDPDTSKCLLADANVAGKQPTHVALNSASLDQPIAVSDLDSDLTIGAHGEAIGTPLYQSPDPGKVCTFSELGSGDAVSLVFITKTATTVSFKINTGGVIPES